MPRAKKTPDKSRAAEFPGSGTLPRGEIALRYIREAIQHGRLKPGDRLREVDLAQMIGLSRTPIREALARLEADGLIGHDSARGIIVMEFDYNMATELYTMREVLEGTAARLAAQHASEVEISMLEELCAQYEQSLADSATLVLKNRLFHETLSRCSHNRYLRKMLIFLHDAVALLGKTSLANPARAAQSLKEHRAIVEAIKKRDAVAAERAARNHIAAAQKTRVKQIIADA